MSHYHNIVYFLLYHIHHSDFITSWRVLHSCVTSQDYYGGYFADNQDNAAANYEYNGDNNEEAEEQEAQAYGNSYYNNEQRNNYEGMYYQKLVHFKLCPSNSCWQCKNGADYVVELNDYVDAVLEAQMTAKEYNCEHVRENCYCGSANSEEECLSGCYSNAGLTDCAEAEDGAFDLQKAVECMNLDVDKDKLAEFYNTQAGNNYAAEGQENKNQVEKLYAGPCEYYILVCVRGICNIYSILSFTLVLTLLAIIP